ncbi:hypothetical protein D3C73_1387570 [compost metagenome]
MAMAYIALGEYCARLILAAQVAACQRYAGQHAKILRLTGRENALLRLAVQPVVYDLNGLGTDLGGVFGLVQIIVAADGGA